MWLIHDGSNSTLQSETGNLRVRTVGQFQLTKSSTENMLIAIPDGSVELYHNNVKTFATIGNGVSVIGPEGGNAEIEIFSDEGDDNADKYRLVVDGSVFYLQNYASGGWESNLKATGNGNVELYHDNNKMLETFVNGIKLYDTDGTQIGEGFDGGFNFTSLVYVDELRLLDNEKIQLGLSQDLQLYHDVGNSWLN